MDPPEMTETAYPTSRAVAQRIEAHFAKKIAAASLTGTVPIPEARAVEEIINAAFWASLLREEGKPTTISLALLAPDQSSRPLTFDPPLALDPATLARVAPAVERPGIHLGVWRHDGELRVWGMTRTVPRLSFVLEVFRPGLLVVKYRRSEASTKFANIAVLEGSEGKFIDQYGTLDAGAPPSLASLLSFYSSAGRQESDDVLVQLAVSMRAHKRGGSLLVVPAQSDEWRASIRHPITYSVIPAYAELAELLRKKDEENRPSRQDALSHAVDAVAGFTAVDGATVITDTYEVLGFGAKIVRRDGGSRVEQIVVSEPVQGAEIWVTDPGQLGGTRHLSAAQFVYDQRNALALVASQDDRFTVFAWSPVHDMVHAHRLETLLI
jgi:hypothetical protein